MRLEDMKSDIPETPDFIHKMIQNEVAKQIQDTKVMNLQRRKTWTIPKIAAVAAACTLAVSTAAYAGVNLYHWFLEKQGAYGVAVKIDAINVTNLRKKIEKDSQNPHYLFTENGIGYRAAENQPDDACRAV